MDAGQFNNLIRVVSGDGGWLPNGKLGRKKVRGGPNLVTRLPLRSIGNGGEGDGYEPWGRRGERP